MDAWWAAHRLVNVKRKLMVILLKASSVLEWNSRNQDHAQCRSRLAQRHPKTHCETLSGDSSSIET